MSIETTQATPAANPAPSAAAKMAGEKVSVFYGAKQALFDVSLEVGRNRVTSLIGPSGCGKSTFLRSLNRMNDTIEGCRVATAHLARRRGHLCARYRRGRAAGPRRNGVPEAEPVSQIDLYENVAYGPRIHGLAARAPSSTRSSIPPSAAPAWNEVKDRLDGPGTGLSGGQRQRLCIARAIATEPEVLLMDEPCSALDPIATAIIGLIDELRQNYTIVIVTHSMQQAARVSQKTAFFHLGKLIEEGATSDIFTNPQHRQTQDYITGRIG